MATEKRQMEEQIPEQAVQYVGKADETEEDSSDDNDDYDDQEMKLRAKEHQKMMLKIPPDFDKAEIHGVSNISLLIGLIAIIKGFQN